MTVRIAEGPGGVLVVGLYFPPKDNDNENNPAQCRIEVYGAGMVHTEPRPVCVCMSRESNTVDGMRTRLIPG